MALEIGQAIRQKSYAALTYTLCAEDFAAFFYIFFSLLKKGWSI